MATHGSLSNLTFEPNKEDWSSYVLRLKYYFKANRVTESDEKKSILLTAVGPTTFRRIGSLLTMARLDSIGFDDLVKEVADFYDPKPSLIVQRFRFNTRQRASNESIAMYVAALRRLAEHCNFSDLNEMLRNRLVCGVNHDTIQTRLLAEKELTFQKALDLSQAVEAAEKNSKLLQNSKPAESQSDQGKLNYTKRGQKMSSSTDSGAASGSGNGPIACYRCGGPHLAPECKFKEVFCRFCKKKGHLAKVCRAKLQNDDASQPGQKLNLVEEHSEESDPENANCYSMFAIRSTGGDPITMDVCINSIPITMEVDTGASLSILCSNTYELIAQQYDIGALEESTATLKTYTGGTIPVLGKVKVAMSCNNHDANLYVHVVQGSGPDLMGRDWLGLFNVSFGVNHLEQSSETTLSLQSVLDKHAALFDGTLGYMKDVEVDLHIKPEAKPKPHPVPYHLKQKTEDELQRLENLAGAISPVKTSKGAAPIVPLVKKTGDVRMCVNFKPLNQDCDTDCYPLPRIKEIFANLKGGKLFLKLDLENAYFQIPLAESSKEFTTINTHKGLFRFNRLPFRVVYAPVIFQCTMETLLRGIKGGTAFTSNEFRQFMVPSGIKHVTSAPYHPSSNGQAERAVLTFKQAIECMGDIPISKFLFSYCLTLHTTIGTSPAELLMGYRPRSLLDNLRPDISQRVEHKQAMQKQSHDSSKPLRTFSVGDKVFVQHFTGTLPKWLSGTIAEVTGPLSYVVTLSDGRTVRRHVDAVRGRTVSGSVHYRG